MSAATTDKAAKAERMAARGFFPAAGPGICCLCRRMIHGGQYIGKMPDSWKPASKRRHCHYKCREQLVARVRARAQAGQ